MRRCLVLANQTLGGSRLLEAIQQRMAARQHEFYVVVPATPVAHQERATVGNGTSTDPARAVAAQRLTDTLDQIRGLGAAADGEVGDPDPLQAVRLALRRFAADEVVVSTLRRGVSRWLRADLPSRIERSFGLPVEHVIGESGSD
ncbi:hypothetical protein IN07_14345 [Modestobacter caceresii]|uniref:Universal stress protein n=1 Tax=Modestobacter caceresii TaxID=1522368 RepID=A0A098Y6A7_9ACTN|nr:hypothetical protein [Modestobacter caceresii]KGH45960.1 hypothetical protein IN07_14345 [Modestobacter caceresii]